MKLLEIYKSILTEADLNAIKKNTEQYFNQCMAKYFSEYRGKMSEWGIPTFKVRSGTQNAGLFSYVPNIGKLSNQSITMNPDIAVNGELLRQVAFHETIHYVQTNLSVRRLSPYEDGKRTSIHDAYFIEMMNKINSGEGSNYVTVKQDAAEILVASKEFYVYGFEDDNGRVATVWSPTENSKLHNWLMHTGKEKYKNIFQFKTDDYYFKTSSSKLKGGTMKFTVVEKADKIELCKKNFIK